MDREEFYRQLRKRGSVLFGTSLSPGQVEGCEAILDECVRQGADLGQAAYILATAHGETGGRMQPVRENMSYSSKRIGQVFSAKRRQGFTASQLARKPKLLANVVYGGEWGERNLGNRPGTDDGWDFRGFWIGQITGRANAKKWSAGLGVDLLGNPALLDSLEWAVKGLVRPMMEGWATGKPLHMYVEGETRNYVEARRVWNGTFEAHKYASAAEQFETALRAAGYEAVEPKAEAQIPAKIGWLEAIIAIIRGKK